MTQFTLADLSTTVEACVGAGGGTEPLTEANLDTALDDLGYDSLSIYEFVTTLQDNLHITITDDEIDSLRTPRSVVDLVNQRLAQAV
ncbi:phosphopantetheine-binding protein [Pseudonocardia spinosispora]|uniref:phosphopantetheine-binding protein n=1 Tax=Pseudonocardia spinosispora TaxID=103441 RepID=UPI00048A67D6|nr:phosphopantetheine-binding protein [Pseudonocardia spinosispora]